MAGFNTISLKLKEMYQVSLPFEHCLQLQKLLANNNRVYNEDIQN